MSSPGFEGSGVGNHFGSFQSFGFVPETTIWIRICPAAGFGIGESLMVTVVLASTTASFIIARVFAMDDQ
jgi:hypothetical protein